MTKRRGAEALAAAAAAAEGVRRKRKVRLD